MTDAVSPVSGASLKEQLRQQAHQLGFDAMGVTAATADPARQRALSDFLAAGQAGDMAWLARHPERRAEPRSLWPEVNSVIALAVNYAPQHDPLAALADRQRGLISVYAQGRDYHDVLKKRLKALARWLVAEHGGDVKVFVDTAPVMEKPLAQSAGLGWQGKHSNLVSRQFGSWLFLGEVFTTLVLPPDAPASDLCGSCRRCQDACPTDALRVPYQVQATACISYLTIEHKGHIPEHLRSALGNRIYGCDDCLAVCPWNKYATPHAISEFLPRGHTQLPRLADLAALDEASFRAVFAGSPIKRTGRDRFVRNVLLAIGNSGDAKLRRHAEARLNDPSVEVREAARWACQQL